MMMMTLEDEDTADWRHLMPQPEFLEGIFLTDWRVLESRRSVCALLPTAYSWWAVSIVDRGD